MRVGNVDPSAGALDDCTNDRETDAVPANALLNAYARSVRKNPFAIVTIDASARTNRERRIGAFSALAQATLPEKAA